MCNNDVVMGIDTSNYTTSVAFVTLAGEVIANLRRPLPVKPGEVGLRQSDAVFAHIKNLPDIMNEAREILAERQPVAVGVSTRPRNIDGSYMPCFLSGVAVANSISATVGIPMYEFSHQCGHIMSALYSSGAEDKIGDEFAAFHVSGGTTELVKVRKASSGFTAELVGGSNDLNAGQVIDRIGVYMDIPFPAGPGLDKIASQYGGDIPKKKISVSGMNANLSGLENMAKKMFDEQKDPGMVGVFVFDYIGRTLDAMRSQYEAEYGSSAFLFGGGVMSNSIIRRILSKHQSSYFALPALSADNAVGIALLTKNTYLN